MPITQIVTNKADYMHLIGHGSVHNSQDFLEWCIAAITKAQQHNQKRLLFDNRTFSLELTRDDILEVIDRLVDMGAHALELRCAVLSSRSNPEISKALETSFVNHAADYRRFECQEEALAWLRS